MTPQIQVIMETPREYLERLESTYPVGTIATLWAPMEADRGLWVAPRLVDTFRKTENMRWTSYPGNDVNYPTLLALSMAAPIREVIVPGPQPAPAPTYPAGPTPGEPQPVEVWYPDDRPPAYIPLDAPVAAKGFPLMLWGAVALGAFFLLRRKG
jgi:hypothetical protein